MIGAMLAGVVAAQAAEVVLSYETGIKKGDTVLYHSCPTGIDGVTAFFTSQAPKGVQGTRRPFVNAKGLAILDDSKKPNFDRGESFRLRVQLYKGFVAPDNRGTEVTDTYTLTLTKAIQRQKPNGSFGITVSDSNRQTSGKATVTGKRAIQEGVVNDFDDLEVSAPLTITSVTPVGDDNLVFQLQGLAFNVVPKMKAVVSQPTVASGKKNGEEAAKRKKRNPQPAAEAPQQTSVGFVF